MVLVHSLVARRWLGPQPPKGLTGPEASLPRQFPHMVKLVLDVWGGGSVPFHMGCLHRAAQMSFPQRKPSSTKTEGTVSILSSLVWELVYG